MARRPGAAAPWSMLGADGDEAVRLLDGFSGSCGSGSSALRRRRLLGPLAVVLALLGAPGAQAATISWVDLAGGDFLDGSRWMGGVAPGSGDVAGFNLGTGSQALAGPVTLSGDANVSALGVVGGQVVLDLSGHDFTASGTSGEGAIQVAPQVDGDEPALTIINSAATPSKLLATQGSVELSGGGALSLTGPTTELDAARVSAGVVSSLPFPPAGTGSPSLVTVDGATLGVSSGLDVGASEDGSLVLQNGAQLVQLPDQDGGLRLRALVGSAAGVTGAVTVKDAGTHLDVYDLVLGGYGTGSLSLAGGAALDAANSVLVGGANLGGTGSLAMSGPSALTTQLLQVGNRLSTGTFHMTGGTLDVRRLVADFGTNSDVALDGGAVTVHDALYLRTGTPFSLGAQLDLDLAGSEKAVFGDDLTLAPGSVLNLNGGHFSAPSVQSTGGALHWNAGSVALDSDLTLGQGQLFGSAVSLGGAKPALAVGGTLTIDGDTTLDPMSSGGSVTLDAGGSLTAGAVDRVNGGTFTWNGGSLSLTASDLDIAAGGLVGDAVTLDPTRSLSVSGATTIAPGASLALDGGKLTTGSLAGSGFSWTGGTLRAGQLQLGTAPGALDTQGAGLDVGAGRTLDVDDLGVADGLVTVDGGTAKVRSSLMVDDAQGGRLDFASGSLSLAGDVAIGAGGVTGAAGASTVTLAAGDALDVAGQLAVPTGSGLVLGGGSLSAGTIAGGVQYGGGILKTGGGLGVAAGGLLGAGGATAVTLAPGDLLDVAGTLDVATGHSLAVAGGQVRMGGLSGEGILFSSGSVGSSGGLLVGAGGVHAASGSDLVLASGDRLSAQNTTIAGGTTLSLQGGELFTNSLGVGSSGHFDLQTGSLTLADEDLYIGSSYSNPSGFHLESNTAAGSPYDYSIGSGASITVGGHHTTFVDTSGLEIQAGGYLSTWELSAPQYVSAAPGSLYIGHLVVSQDSVWTGSAIADLVDVSAHLTLGFNALLFSQVAVASGGTLSGTGQITGGLTNAGILSPGASPGQLTVDGFFTQASTGTLTMEVGRDAQTQAILHDVLSVSGVATLDGVLDLVTDTTSTGLDPLFDPATEGALSWTALTASSVVGSFASVTGAAVGNGLKWVVEYFNDHVDVSLLSAASPDAIDYRVQGVPASVPEPRLAWLLLLALAVVWTGRRTMT